MKHIPTTATAVRKLKILAKKLKVEHGITLAQAQDRAAQETGYEHFHHATHCASTTKSKAAEQSQGLGQLAFMVEAETTMWTTYDADGCEKGQVRRFAGEFIASHSQEAIDEVTEELDDLVFEVEGGFGDMGTISLPGLQKIIEISQKLTQREPAFLDGYAHWAGALVELERYDDCIAMASPVYDAACALIPPTFKGYIPYLYLENRPFHRLAVNLLLAHYGAGQDVKAKAIASRMLKWWPSDNIGFRFLLVKPVEV